MRYRRLTADISVSEIGFGAWGIGGVTPGPTSYGRTDDVQSLRALATALEHGITFYDTAPAYGAGHSETLLGQAFASRRGDVIIATKAGVTDFQAPPDFTPPALRRSVDASLTRLRTDYVDLVQLHCPPSTGPDLEAAMDAMATMRREGRCRAFGVSTNSPDDALALLHKPDRPDCLQVNMNLMDQRAATNGLLDKAAECDVGLIIRTPLCFGMLATGPETVWNFPPEDHRSRWPQPQIRCWQEGSRLFMESVAESGKCTPAQVALRFCLSFPGVSTTIPGILTPAQAGENAAASDLGPLGAADLDAIAAVYAGNSFFVKRT